MNELSILGRNICLQPRTKAGLKGITIGDSLEYYFYDGEYHGTKILFLRPRKLNPSPRICAITATRLSALFGLPVVFILSTGPAYERQRLIDKGVFFVMGDQFAYLPMLIANERVRKSKTAKRLTPVAQYMLFYHLQIESLEGLSSKEISDKLPYSYESITLGITCLSDLGLGEKITTETPKKVIHFIEKGKSLWDKSLPYLIDPVEKRLYCDNLISNAAYTKCNINALAHYSWLNPDNIEMIMMDKTEYKALETAHALRNANIYDGNVMIEIWKYPVVSPKREKKEWVDKLSLVKSLQYDNDARVEGEVERVINEIEWKD